MAAGYPPAVFLGRMSVEIAKPQGYQQGPHAYSKFIGIEGRLELGSAHEQELLLFEVVAFDFFLKFGTRGEIEVAHAAAPICVYDGTAQVDQILALIARFFLELAQGSQFWVFAGL